MPLRKSSVLFAPYISIRMCMSHIKAVLTQIVLILLVATSLQAAAIFDSTSPEITADEARSLGAKLADNLMYVGDIILYPQKADTFAIGGQLWPNGTLIYQFSQDLEDSEKQAFLDACQAWTLSSSSVICQERTTETNFVLISEHDGSGCGGDAQNVSCSALGMVGGSQDLEVYQDHWAVSHALQHEIGHAFGLIHEHGRKDRDSFVHINEGNIQSGQEGQFSYQSSTFSTDYDLQSLMHYSNCTFSKHSSCTLTNKADHTLVPAACHLDKVGGTAITALDYDSIKSAYASPLYLLFPRERARRCGVLDYSLTQRDETCAPHCATLGDPLYEKVETKKDSWCGSVPFFEYQDYCSAEKPYLDHGWDYDYFACGWLRTRSEVGIRCGCAHQLTLAQCANTAGPINSSKLQDLLDSSVPRELNAGRFVKRVLAIQKNGNLETDVYTKMGDFLIDNYNHQGFATSIKNLTCLVKIFMAGKLVVNPTYTLSLSSFRNLANQTGLRTNSL